MSATRGLELIAAQEWLVETLRGDTALMALAPGGVWEHPVPHHVSPDVIAITIQPETAEDVNALGASRVLTDSEWLIRASTRGDSKAPLIPVYLRIDALLDGATCVDVTYGHVYGCRRERPFSAILAEPDAGGPAATVRFAHLGGFYRIHTAGD